MWDTLLTLSIVAVAVVFIARRLLLRTPHCGSEDSGCRHCPQSSTQKIGQEVDL